jgi:hypothetical protein
MQGKGCKKTIGWKDWKKNKQRMEGREKEVTRNEKSKGKRAENGRNGE